MSADVQYLLVLYVYFIFLNSLFNLRIILFISIINTIMWYLYSSFNLKILLFLHWLIKHVINEVGGFVLAGRSFSLNSACSDCEPC